MRYLDFARSSTANTNEKPERLIVCVDASPSMLSDDWKPSRLRGAQNAALALVQRKHNQTPEDEIGVVTYARSAHIMCNPLVVGEKQAKIRSSIQAITTGSHTNISAGLRAAGELLFFRKRSSLWDRLIDTRQITKQVQERSLRIILLTDGENTSGTPPILVAKELKNAGVVIDCIGIGGSPSKVNELELKAIASVGLDGITPRYAFIGDTSSLIQKFEQLAGRITR